MRFAVVFSVLLSVNSALALDFDRNVPENIKETVTTDLALIYSIQGTSGSPLHQQIFGSVSGSDYKKFFEGRISSVGLSDCGDPHAIACLIPLINPNKMYLTSDYNPAYLPQIARIGWYFNIARHSDPQHNFWSNATCPTPFNDENGRPLQSPYSGILWAGEPDCEISPVGAYSSVAILLQNISRNCANCSPELRSEAHSEALIYLKRIINPDALQRVLQDSF